MLFLLGIEQCNVCCDDYSFSGSAKLVADSLVFLRMSEKGVEFKGGSLHDSFGGSGEHLALIPLVLPNTQQKGNRGGLTVLAVSVVSVVVAVSVVTATPLKLNPPFRHPDFLRITWRFVVVG